MFASTPGSHPSWVPEDASSQPPDFLPKMARLSARRDYSRFAGNKKEFTEWRARNKHVDLTPMGGEDAIMEDEDDEGLVIV